MTISLTVIAILWLAEKQSPDMQIGDAVPVILAWFGDCFGALAQVTKYRAPRNDVKKEFGVIKEIKRISGSDKNAVCQDHGYPQILRIMVQTKCTTNLHFL